MKRVDTGYIRSLDGIRALAIILVMSFHAGITHFGWMGVQLFFVLSGYLITGILWKEKAKEDPLSFKFKRFWTRRSLRIFPLYFGYLIVLGITWLLVHFPSYYTTYAPYLFTYTFNYTRLLPQWQGNPLFTHLWSLSIEEQFYLFYPLVIFLLPRHLIKYFLFFFILFSPFTRYLLGEYYKSKTTLLVAADAVYWNTLSHLDAFFMGGLIPVLALDKKITRPRMLFLFSLLLVVALGILNYYTSGHDIPFWSDLGYNHDQPENYAHVWRYSVLNLFFASLILVLTTTHQQRPGMLRRFFENAIMVRIGKVSYGMYIFHWLIYVYIFDRLFSPQSVVMKLAVFLPYLLAVYLLAAASFRWYESYFIRLKDVLFNRKKDAMVQRFTAP
ncbi:MAG: acyltransferase family protein [Flavisolibacter sp.]